jgi:hypothetical protein
VCGRKKEREMMWGVKQQNDDFAVCQSVGYVSMSVSLFSCSISLSLSLSLSLSFFLSLSVLVSMNALMGRRQRGRKNDGDHRWRHTNVCSIMHARKVRVARSIKYN